MTTMIAEKTLEDLGWPALRGFLAARCSTARGAEAASLLLPLPTLAEARARIADVAEARLLVVQGAPMTFGGIQDVEAWCVRAERGGTLEGAELLAIGETVAGTAALRRHLQAHKEWAPRLAERTQAIQELSHVSGPILDSIEPGGRLGDHASPALGPLRRRVAQLHDELGRRARALLDDPAIAPYLQDRFTTQREDRYVVPLRIEARARVKGIVHGTSQSGQTVFVEPEEIVDLNNRLKIAESKVADEERRILVQLTGYVSEERAAIRDAVAVAAALDLVAAAARVAETLGGSAPEIGDDGAVLLRRARHPLMLLHGRGCVANDIELAPGTSLIISGPNAGGKTVALKTLGLTALMARAGLHVAAEAGSRIPFFRSVLTDIGDGQSLERDLSTFSAHLTNLQSFLAAAGPGVLVLVDELAVGTDPEQGAALAQAVLEVLAVRGAQVVVTTHYERLKALPHQDARFLNAQVGFDLERLTPTFELRLGLPGSSGALLLARRLGIPEPVVARAEALSGEHGAGMEQLLGALSDERRRLEEERAAAALARDQAERVQAEAHAICLSLEADRRALRRRAHDEAVAELRCARDELARLRAVLKHAADAATPSAETALSAGASVSALAERIALHMPPALESVGSTARRARPAREEELVRGARVVVPQLGAGIVAFPPERGRVVVQIGALRATAAVADVRIDPETPRLAPASELRSPKAGTTGLEPRRDPSPRTAGNTLDLRGERVDAALSRLDRFLDDALLAGEDVVFVVHGHGTGALRSAVRDHLDQGSVATSWQSGEPRDGGDGVTMVRIGV